MIERRLRDRGDWLGASCVCRYRDLGFLLAGHVRDGALLLSGIGGKVEPQETFREAAVREFAEETGAELTIEEVPRPRHLTPEAAEIPVPAGAGALVAIRVPDGTAERLLWIAVFAGTVTQTPRPVEKVPHFVLVPPATFARAERVPDLDALAVLDGPVARPARDVLPSGTVRVEAVLTARAVLTAPDLLTQWWAATAGRPAGAPGTS
ncbi:MAG: NUDIX domain-containing protein [Mycobacteriales bacterium]